MNSSSVLSMETDFICNKKSRIPCLRCQNNGYLYGEQIRRLVTLIQANLQRGQMFKRTKERESLEQSFYSHSQCQGTGRLCTCTKLHLCRVNTAECRGGAAQKHSQNVFPKGQKSEWRQGRTSLNFTEIMVKEILHPLCSGNNLLQRNTPSHMIQLFTYGKTRKRHSKFPFCAS